MAREAEFMDLRRKLDQFEYREPLGIESYALVRHLFEDVVGRTREVDSFNVERAAMLREIKHSKDQVDPLARENSRLLKENNDLHAQMIKDAEAGHEVRRKMERTQRKLEDNARDSDFMKEQLARQLAGAQAELAELRERYDSVATSGRAGQGSARMELSRPLGPRATPPRSGAPAVDAATADVLRAAEADRQALQLKVDHLTTQLTECRDKNALLTEQVAARDGEIHRLAQRVQSGRDPGQRQLEEINHQHNLEAEKLRLQVDILQEQLAQTQSEAKRYSAHFKGGRGGEIEAAMEEHVREVEAKNQRLVTEMKTLRDEVARLTRDHEKGRRGWERAIQEKDEKLEYQGRANETAAEERTRLVEENTRLRIEQGKYGGMVESYHTEKKHYADLIARLEKEKTDLGHRCDLLENQVADLRNRLEGAQQESNTHRLAVAEMSRDVETYQQTITRLQRTEEQSGRQNRLLQQSADGLQQLCDQHVEDNRELQQRLHAAEGDLAQRTTRLQGVEKEYEKLLSNFERQSAEVRNLHRSFLSLEQERDYYKKQADTQLRDISAGRDAAMSNAQHIDNLEQEMRRLKVELASVSGDRQELDNKLTETTIQLRLVKQERDTQKRIQEEMEHFPAEAGKLGKEVERLSEEAGARTVEYNRLSRENNENRRLGQEALAAQSKAEKELAAAKQEIERLMAVVREFDRQQTEVQAVIRTLTRERNELSEELSQARTDVRLRTGTEKEVTLELDRVRAQARENQATNDTLDRQNTMLRDELVATQAALSAAQADLRAKDSSVDRAITASSRETSERRLVERERDNARAEVRTLNARVNELTEERARLQSDLTTTRGGLNDRQGELQQLTSVVVQSDRMRTELAEQLSNLRTELLNSREETRRMRQHREDLEVVVTKRDAEILQLRELLGAVDRDRDNLQFGTDRRAEEIVALRREIQLLKENEAELTASYQALQGRADGLTKSLNDRDREILSLRRQADAFAEDRARCEAELAQTRLQVGSLDEDLKNMTRENQVINGQLQRAALDRDGLKQENQEYMARALYVDNLVKVGEVERGDLHDQYRKLAEEYKIVGNAAQQIQSERDAMRNQVIAQERHVAELQNHIRVLEQENNAYVIDLQAFERQVAHLSRDLGSADARRDDWNAERENLVRDLNAARELVLTTEQTRDALHRELVQMESEMKTVTLALEEARANQVALDSQLRYERDRSKQLEDVLTLERTKQMRLEIGDQERAVEVTSLRERIQALQQREAEMAREVKMMREGRSQAELEVERQKRQASRLDMEKDQAVGEQAELRQRTLTLQATIDQQDVVVRDLEQERLKLKEYIIKYEAELQQAEANAKTLKMQQRQYEEELVVAREESNRRRLAERAVQDELVALQARERTHKDQVVRDSEHAILISRQAEQLQQQMALKDREMATLRLQMEELRRANAQSAQENKKLEETLERMAANWQQYNRQLKAHLESSTRAGNISAPLTPDLSRMHTELETSLGFRSQRLDFRDPR